MGTMNGMQRPSLSDEAVARLIDPRTGQRLRPLGVVGGRFVWPQMGASPDDPSDTGSGEGGGTDGGGNDPEDGTDSSKDSDKDGDADKGSKPDGNPDAKIEDLEQEKERHYRRRKEAEQERDAARKELEELKGKDAPELEKLQNKVTELETQTVALQEQLRDRTLENAFLKDNTYTWHNPGRALKLADLSKVEIDDDGTVHGLKQALDALAKSDAYLLKQEESKVTKEEPPNTGGDKKNPSKREQKGKSDKDKQAELARKYPALRR